MQQKYFVKVTRYQNYEHEPLDGKDEHEPLDFKDEHEPCYDERIDYKSLMNENENQVTHYLQRRDKMRILGVRVHLRNI